MMMKSDRGEAGPQVSKDVRGTMQNAKASRNVSERKASWVSCRYQPGGMVEKLWGRGRLAFGTEVGSPEGLVERTAISRP